MNLELFKKVSELINRFCNCMQLNIVYAYGEEVPLELYTKVRIVRNYHIGKNTENGIIFIAGDDAVSNNSEAILKSDICIFLCNRLPSKFIGEGNKVLEMSSGVYKYLILHGEIFNPIKEAVAKNFKILSIMHVYNEADIIERTINYLLSQDVDICIFDNWSDDGSYEIVERLQTQNPERIKLERFPADYATGQFNLYLQMQMTEEISRMCEYDWFIHYDADEIRISPWKGFNLRETIFLIDRMGYNLIDNTVIDFKLIDPKQSDIFMQDTWFDFGRKKTHFEQIKTWKKSPNVELAKNGGHTAIVDTPKVFPLKILNRHYPLRSVEQANRKIYRDRLPRFESERKLRGWHGHYDKIGESGDFICDKQKLYRWDENTFDELWIPLFTGAGIVRERQDISESSVEKLEKLFRTDEKHVIYGAGKYGKIIYKVLSSKYEIITWVDKNHTRLPRIYAVKIMSPEVLRTTEFDKVIISVDTEKVSAEICNELEVFGVPSRKIIWKKWSEIIEEKAQ